MSTEENLPQILKAFLADVYDLNFPQSLEDKIALETKKALNQVLLENIEVYEQLNAQAQAQQQAPLAPEPVQEAPAPQSYAQEPQYEQAPQGYVPTALSQQAPSRAPPTGRVDSNASGSNYNLLTGQAQGAQVGQPYSPPRTSMRQYAQSNASNDIFGTSELPPARTGRRYSQNQNVNTQSNGEEPSRPARRGNPRASQQAQGSSFSINEGYEPEGSSSAYGQRESAYRTRPGPGPTPRQQDYEDNQRIYTASRTRNMRSNVF